MASGWERSWDKGAREGAQEAFNGRQVVSIEGGLSSSQTKEVFEILDEFPLVLVDADSRGNMYAIPSLRRFTRAFGFEPDAEECARLNADSATLEGHKSVEHVPMALARTPGPVTLNICKNPNNTSFLMPNEPLLDRIILAGYDPRNEFPVVGTFECEATTIDEFMADKKLPYLDFIKLDTQGSELDIIEGGEKTFGETLLAATIEVDKAPSCSSNAVTVGKTKGDPFKTYIGPVLEREMIGFVTSIAVIFNAWVSSTVLLRESVAR